MDAKKLEILMTAVDLGSFSKASEVVGYTQSGLTHLVDSLEREIGFPLIRRSYSGVPSINPLFRLLPLYIIDRLTIATNKILQPLTVLTLYIIDRLNN